MHPGTSLYCEQFGNATRDVWDVEAVASKCNEISAPAMSANGATALQQHILRCTKDLLRPVGDIYNGVQQVLNYFSRNISKRDDPKTQ